MLKKINFYFILFSFLYHGKVLASEGGMPQLNTEFWVSQIFWLTIIFGSLYILLSKLVLPKISNNFFNSNFLLGLFSSVSMFSYIDIGAYLNVFLFFLIIVREIYKLFKGKELQGVGSKANLRYISFFSIST